MHFTAKGLMSRLSRDAKRPPVVSGRSAFAASGELERAGMRARHAHAVWEGAYLAKPSNYLV